VKSSSEIQPIHGNCPWLGAGALPEIPDEDLVPCRTADRANTAPLGADDIQDMQMLADLLNNRITPVAYSRGAWVKRFSRGKQQRPRDHERQG